MLLSSERSIIFYSVAKSIKMNSKNECLWNFIDPQEGVQLMVTRMFRSPEVNPSFFVTESFFKFEAGEGYDHDQLLLDTTNKCISATENMVTTRGHTVLKMRVWLQSDLLIRYPITPTSHKCSYDGTDLIDELKTFHPPLNSSQMFGELFSIRVKVTVPRSTTDSMFDKSAGDTRYCITKLAANLPSSSYTGASAVASPILLDHAANCRN